MSSEPHEGPKKAETNPPQQEAPVITAPPTPTPTSEKAPAKDGKDDKANKQQQEEAPKPKPKAASDEKKDWAAQMMDMLQEMQEKLHEAVGKLYSAMGDKMAEKFKATKLGQALTKATDELSSAIDDKKQELKDYISKKAEGVVSDVEDSATYKKMKSGVDSITDKFENAVVGLIGKATKAIQGLGADKEGPAEDEEADKGKKKGKEDTDEEVDEEVDEEQASSKKGSGLEDFKKFVESMQKAIGKLLFGPKPEADDMGTEMETLPSSKQETSQLQEMDAEEVDELSGAPLTQSETPDLGQSKGMKGPGNSSGGDD